MRIITDFRELPWLYAEHFNRSATLTAIKATNNRVICHVSVHYKSRFGELPHMSPKSFRFESVNSPSSEVNEVIIDFETDTIFLLSSKSQLTYPLEVHYSGSNAQSMLIPEPFRYQENQPMKLSPVHRFFRFVPPVGHFYTISQGEADSIINGAALNEHGEPLNHFYRYEGVAFYAVHPHDYKEE